MFGSILQNNHGLRKEGDIMTFTKQMRHNILRICRHFGSDLQKLKAIEELYELIEAVKLESIGRDNREHVLEEMSDVYIMLEQLKKIYHITNHELLKVCDYKIQRTLTRIGK